MCMGCPDFIKAKTAVIESAAKLQHHRLLPLLSDYEDLCQTAYVRIIEAKESVPDLINKPNAYLHRLVANLNVDAWRQERRASRVAEHAELIEHHVKSRSSQNPDRMTDIKRLFDSATTEDERRALLSVANDESLDDYAEAISETKGNASVKRMRLISRIAKRLNEGGR